jgi:hypothetical protein
MNSKMNSKTATTLNSPSRHRSRVLKCVGAIAGGLSLIAVNAPLVQATVPNQTTFNLFVANPNLIPCVAADGKTAPTIRVTVTRGQRNDQMTIRTQGLKSRLQLDAFTVQNSILKADRTPIPNFQGFGLAWYQSDVGSGTTTIRTILLDQIFGFVQRNPQTASPLQPTRTFHVGLWFNNPDDAVACNPNRQRIVTPFNGELQAGPLAFISVPDARTGLGPLCVNPNTSTNPVSCNP